MRRVGAIQASVVLVCTLLLWGCSDSSESGATSSGPDIVETVEDAGGEDVAGPEDASGPVDASGPEDAVAAPDTQPCTPDCVGKVCGDDGCGGSCSECAEGTGCTEGACVPPPNGYVFIPAGTFTMGSPPSEQGHSDDETEHEVTLTRSFAMKATEVTQAEWEVLMGNNPSGWGANTISFECGLDCPVEQVNWYEALAYCNALSTAEGLEACYTLIGCGDNEPGTGMECTGVTVTAPDGDVYGCEGYRLPTEAEWEYAARAGTTTATYNGDYYGDDYVNDVSPVLEPIAWYFGNSGYTPHWVAGKWPNPWGLHDMLGNVWEWTWDWYAAYPGDVMDPVGPTTGTERVNRGCCYMDTISMGNCRAAHRDADRPKDQLYVIGFRPAITLD